MPFLKHYRPHLLLLPLKRPIYLDRKALMSPYLKANLAFMRSITHSTPSVFYADQRGMLGFLIRTLGPEIWGHPQPHEEPQHQQGQGLILENIS